MKGMNERTIYNQKFLDFNKTGKSVGVKIKNKAQENIAKIVYSCL